jgi:hypothetical protein
MAFKHGKATSVWLGGKDLSPFLNATDFSVDVDTADTTTYGSTWKSAAAGQAGSKTDFAGLYDPTLADLVTLLAIDPGPAGTVLTYAPAGSLAIGDLARLVSVVETGYAESSPVGGMVACKYQVLGSGAVGIGQVLHLLTIDTGTTIGAEKDDLAATATGWMAHLHVIAQTGGGSWVVKLQDAAVSNTYTDLAGGAFTAAVGATAQRLAGAPGSTLRRFVRYVATVTGGTTPTLTFALAYSRNNT